MKILKMGIAAPMSLKQFMLRAEVIKMYRSYMRLGRMISKESDNKLRLEWESWVRSEFKMRKDVQNEDAIKLLLTHGKRQHTELERTILIASS